MPPTVVACVLILSLTFCPKILKPARAMSATTPTRMMYSTRFAPRLSLIRSFVASVSLFIVVISFTAYGRSGSTLGHPPGLKNSGERGGDHGAGRLEVAHEPGPHGHEREDHHEPHGSHEDHVFRRDCPP